MNHNILNKIIDQISLNQWQEKIDQVNQEYHRYFECHDDNTREPILIFKTNFCILYYVKLYNWRNSHSPAPFICYCLKCYCLKCKEKHVVSLAYPINY